MILTQDATRYFVSLPSNRLQLWFMLESERFRVRSTIIHNGLQWVPM